MRESALEAKCKKYTEREGGLLIKLYPYSFRGLPDRLLIAPNGFIVFIEFKTPTGKVSAAQKVAHKALEAVGAWVYVVRTFDEFIAVWESCYH